ncbi:hypothetical protein DSO57_1005388 [Entomophthora muscae]|uniref:Uncharacterized protein n=1 Tax=Entomophthora muscae TaxID=34485 RepID=A0ACC2RYV4_9FUNG|nr:hypothetical protein DSO57_1005388 [Entomophthora muscae]
MRPTVRFFPGMKLAQRWSSIILTAKSFFRQLNLYGFTRTYDGRKSRGKGLDMHCSFYHANFTQLGDIDMTLIRRGKKKATCASAKGNSKGKKISMQDDSGVDLNLLYLINSFGYPLY